MKRKQTELQALSERVEMLEEMLHDCAEYVPLPSGYYFTTDLEAERFRIRLARFKGTFRKTQLEHIHLREAVERLRERTKVSYCDVWEHNPAGFPKKCGMCGMVKREVWEMPEPPSGMVPGGVIFVDDVTKVTDPPTDS